jgi:hypothetical protein
MGKTVPRQKSADGPASFMRGPQPAELRARIKVILWTASAARLELQTPENIPE